VSKQEDKDRKKEERRKMKKSRRERENKKERMMSRKNGREGRMEQKTKNLPFKSLYESKTKLIKHINKRINKTY